MAKFYFPITILFIFSTTFLQAQSLSNQGQKGWSKWSFHVKYGVPFYAEKEPTFSSFETDIRHLSSYHTSVGAGYQYFILEKMSLKAGVSYELGSYLTLENYSYTSAGGVLRAGEIKEHYLTHSLLFPVEVRCHTNRLSLSADLSPAIRLASKVVINRRHWVDDVLVEVNEEISFRDGDRLTYAWGDYTNVDLERKLDFQIALGLHYRVSNRLSLDFGVRQNISENRLVKEVFNYDVVNSLIDYFNPYPRIFTVGVSYNLPKKS